MRILLFNDNPVVQKLVALSAQKTKDELSIVSSPEEIKEERCDLLIVDDGLFSGEAFAAIKGHIVFKSALLMATRGNAVPAGFDHVINKPFLPTDLVDRLIQVDKEIHESALSQPEEASEWDEWEDFEDEIPKTAILDQEELQEVRELLEDADSDTMTDEEFDFDILDEGEEETNSDDSLVSRRQSDVTDPFDFDALDDLEWQIQEAIEDLGSEDLDKELSNEMFGSFRPYGGESKDEPFDELDLLDERELKLAIGEEINEESDAYRSESTPASTVAEALGEVMGKPIQWNNEAEKSSAELKTTPAEGVAALQVLLRALANEEVAKSFKGVNISININFGNNA